MKWTYEKITKEVTLENIYEKALVVNGHSFVFTYTRHAVVSVLNKYPGCVSCKKKNETK
jgi:hypothetical protein